MRNLTFLFSAGMGLLMGLSLVFSSCQEGAPSAPATSPDGMTADRGPELYATYCTRCHGTDGKLQLGGAPNLATSTLTPEETLLKIQLGRKAMPAFENLLNPIEQQQVLEYVLKLRVQ